MAKPLILAREANVIRVAFGDPKPPAPRFPGASGARLPALEMQPVAAIAFGAPVAPTPHHTHHSGGHVPVPDR